MNEETGICIDFDGIYCPKCHELHPTLYWHEKYDKYLEPTQWKTSHKKSLERFGITHSEEELATDFADYLSILKLRFTEVKGACVVCGHETKYQNIRTDHYICCDECKYSDWKVFSYTLSMTADPDTFKSACHRIEQYGAVKEKEPIEDVDGSLMITYRINDERIRIDSDVAVDAVYVDSQVDLSDILKGMILLASKY